MKKLIIGYRITGPDNDTYLFQEGRDKTVCEVLDYIENREKYLTDSFRVKRANFDFSYTYDSALIVSQKFRDFCLRSEYRGLHFYQLKNQDNLYLFKTDNIVEFDFGRRQTKFEDYHETCKLYNSVAGATPICLKSNEILIDGVYRTDLKFGSGYEQSPLIIIGRETYGKMQTEKFRGTDFEQILDKYNWENK